MLYSGLSHGVKDPLVVPMKELQYELLRTHHSSGATGHPDISHTYAKDFQVLFLGENERHDHIVCEVS